MAPTLTEEALRAVQDTFSVHKALRPRHALINSNPSIFGAFVQASGAKHHPLGQRCIGGICLVGIVAMVCSVDVEGLVLDR